MSSVALLFLVLLTTVVKAQELPTSCYHPESNLVDLSTCSVMPWDIPSEFLEDGYLGVNGRYVPGLASYELNSFNPGYFLIGNATYANSEFVQGEFLKDAEKWNLNVEDYRGGIITDSCAYVGGTAWIRVNGSTWDGPFLIVDCAAFIHKFERVCSVGTVIELSYTTFAEYKERGRLDHMEVYLKPTTDLSPPPANVGIEPINYAASWLDASGLPC